MNEIKITKDLIKSLKRRLPIVDFDYWGEACWCDNTPNIKLKWKFESESIDGSRLFVDRDNNIVSIMRHSITGSHKKYVHDNSDLIRQSTIQLSDHDKLILNKYSHERN